MAWSDNVRCLYCDGKLPLYRKITSGQFCSAAHRKSYWQDQERLAVERLHQTHDSLRAYRSPEALEAILGKPAASEPISIDKYYLAGQPPEPDLRDVESRPSVEEMARSASNTGNVKFAGFLTEEKPALRAWHALLAAWDTEFAQWPMSTPAIPSCSSARDERSLPTANGLAVPLFHAVGLAAQIRAAAEKAQPVEFIAKLIAKVPFAIAPETAELSRAFLETLKAAEVVPEPVLQAEPALEAQSLVEETALPFAEPVAAPSNISIEPAALVLHADAPEPQQIVTAITRMEPLPFTKAPRAMAARAGAAGDAKPMELKTATGAPSMKFALAATAPEMQLAAGHGYAVLNSAGAAPAKLNAASAPSAQALELRSETSSPSLHFGSQSLELNLRPAPGCRYDVQSQPGPIQQAGASLSGAGDEISIAPAPVKQLGAQSLKLGLGIAGLCELPVQSAAGAALPIGSTEALAARNELRILPLPAGLVKAVLHPPMAGIRPLAFAPTACAPSAPQPDTRGVDLIYAANKLMNPVAKLEPLDGSVTPQRHGFLAAFGGAQDGKHAWTHAMDFWQNAPRDLKLLAIAIPILLGLALRPSLPKVRVTAPATNGNISRNLGDGIRAQFVNVRNSVAQRAAVALNEDFRSGLDEWQTRGDLSTGWAFDENGFVKPGTLALYRPSLGLRDYDFEFLGLIDKKALSWVVRAKDFDNYYVVKLVVTKAGSVPTMGITRYAVIDGKAEASVSTVAAINARPDMLYRVTMDVHDDTFLLRMQDTVVDNWSEPRLKRGGVGFFASRGEESRLRWLNITHQYDMLGRLCAYLAPYNIPTTDGSW
jgi:hypothetical protein